MTRIIDVGEAPPREEEAKPARNIDAELEELLRSHRATIKVVGAGGAGNNTITRLMEIGIEGAETIIANTDAQDLLYSDADKKLLLGKEITHGLGAGADPTVGESAARENEPEIKEALMGADMVFVTAGMGGGTGTGSAHVIAEVSKKLGALTVAVVTMPFEMEGGKRYENARYGLEKLQNVVDTLILIPNDKLLEIVPNVPINTAFKVADEILVNAVKGITELVTQPGLVNLDFADIRAVMNEGGVAMIGLGESDTESRAKEAVEKAINNPLLDVDITGARGALINVAGGPDLTLKEAEDVVSTISQKLAPDAKIIWGAQISKEMQSTVRVMIIVTGVSSPQIFAPQRTIQAKKSDEMKAELGIEFIMPKGKSDDKPLTARQ